MDFKKYLDCNSKKLLTVENISNSIYETLLLNSRSPVLIKNGAENWPAMKKWSLDFFKSQDGAENVKVFVEKGNLMQNETQFERVSFCDYLNLLEKPSQNHLGLIPYLSVFEAFSIFSHLNDDVDFSMLTRYRFKNKMKCWFGPKGTVTGYHIDWSDNVLAQIKGRKLVKLVYSASIRLADPATINLAG